MWKMRDHGCSKIYWHPQILWQIIESKHGVTFHGQKFNSVEAAKQYAECYHITSKE